ncbi:hypothetical protein FOA52_012597 [Chlamydomonas sp. UWO 241]|nr:hypothetical protein FOA52_012597 [Chlamydomonas sp. UWO 241]
MAPRFKYVYIPANSGDEMVEREMEVPEGKDVECFLDSVKAHLLRAGGTKNEAMRAAQKEQLLAQLGPQAASIDVAVLENAMNIQMVENIALLPNSKETDFVGVNMYCDDQAQIKQLDLNPRASQVAMACGKRLEVRGDAFLARVFDNEDDFKRLDLGLAEVSSSAAWVKQAAAIALRKAAADPREQNDFLERMRAQQGRPPAPPPAATVRELSPAEVEKDAGNAAVKRSDWAGAAERYSAALVLDPSMTAACNNRALCYLKLGRHSEAEADCSVVIKAEPRNVKALLRRMAVREAQSMRKLALRPSPPRAMGTRSKTLKDLNNLNLMALGAGMAAIAADAAAAAGGAGAGEESMEGVMVVAGTPSPRACLLTPGRGTRGATNAEVPSSAMSSPVRAPADHDEMHMGIPPPDPSAAMHRGMRELLREEFAEQRDLIREEFSRGMAALAARVTETEARVAGVIAAVATLDARITSKFAQADVAFGPLLRLVPELSVAKDGVADLDERMGRMEKHEVLALAQFHVDQGKSREMAAKVAALTEQVQALEAAARGGEAAGRQVPVAARAPVTVAQPVPAAQQQLPGPPQPPGPPPLPAAVSGGGLTFAVVVRERVSDARHALARGTERALTTLLGPHHVTVVQARVMFANDHKSKVVFTVANEGHAAFIRARMLLPRCTANMRRPGCAIFPHLPYAEHQSQRRMAMRGVNVKKSEGVVFNDQFCPVGAAGGRALLRRMVAREAQGVSGAAGALSDAQAVLAVEPGNKEAAAVQSRLLPPPPPLPQAAQAEEGTAGEVDAEMN